MRISDCGFKEQAVFNSAIRNPHPAISLLLFVNDAVLHHENRLLHFVYVLERVAGDGCDVSPLADGERACVLVPTEEACAAHRARDD